VPPVLIGGETFLLKPILTDRSIPELVAFNSIETPLSFSGFRLTALATTVIDALVIVCLPSILPGYFVPCTGRSHEIQMRITLYYYGTWRLNY